MEDFDETVFVAGLPYHLSYADGVVTAHTGDRAIFAETVPGPRDVGNAIAGMLQSVFADAHANGIAPYLTGDPPPETAFETWKHQTWARLRDPSRSERSAL